MSIKKVFTLALLVTLANTPANGALRKTREPEKRGSVIILGNFELTKRGLSELVALAQSQATIQTGIAAEDGRKDLQEIDPADPSLYAGKKPRRKASSCQ